MSDDTKTMKELDAEMKLTDKQRKMLKDYDALGRQGNKFAQIIARALRIKVRKQQGLSKLPPITKDGINA